MKPRINHRTESHPLFSFDLLSYCALQIDFCMQSRENQKKQTIRVERDSLERLSRSRSSSPSLHHNLFKMQVLVSTETRKDCLSMYLLTQLFSHFHQLLHGPNLNLLGTREPEKYGTQTLKDIVDDLHLQATKLKDLNGNSVEVEAFQTNHEGQLIDAIHA